MTSSLHEQRIFLSNVLLSVIECVCACECVFTMSHDLPCILFNLSSCSQIYANLHYPFIPHCVCVGNRWREPFQVSCSTTWVTKEVCFPDMSVPVTVKRTALKNA